jgi:hypothetical protein
MGAYGMDAAVSTLAPRRTGLNAPSNQAPDTIDTVNTLVSIKVNINNGQKFNADHVEMQDVSELCVTHVVLVLACTASELCG